MTKRPISYHSSTCDTARSALQNAGAKSWTNSPSQHEYVLGRLRELREFLDDLAQFREPVLEAIRAAKEAAPKGDSTA